MKNFEKSKNIIIKFVILPYEHQLSNNCDKKFLLPQKKIIKVLKENKFDYINLTKNFCDYSNPEKLYINFDPVHLSVKGHGLVFKLIKNEIN